MDRGPGTTAAGNGLTRASDAQRRIVHVAARYPPALGGMEKVVQYLARAQHQLGARVAVITSDEGENELRHETDSIPVSRLKSFSLLRTPFMPGLPRQLMKVDRASVIHLHISHAYTPEVVWLYGHMARRPYIVHFHGDLGPSGGPGSILFRIYKPLVLGLVLRHARAVVVLTEADKSIVTAAFGVDPARTFVVHNGVDESFFRSERQTIQPRPRLLFVGRLAAQKNLPLLLQALDGISERFETTLVGCGELEGDLRAMAQRLRVQNVCFYGVAQGPELVALYHDADVFVLPSIVEGMPLALLEAMASGLPVVATDIPGTRDLVSHGRNGLLVPADDPSAFREALLSVVDDTRRYRQMSASAREVGRRYSWDTASAELERIYSWVCGDTSDS